MTVSEKDLRMIDGPTLEALLPVDAAIDAVRSALLDGLDPSATPPRTHVPVTAGQLLLMPAEHGDYAGVKIAGVAPGNAQLGLDRITGAYLLLDAATLIPLAVLDGAVLTLRRTSAVSALAVDCLATPEASRLLVYGTGPQALAHAEAVQQVRPLSRVDVAGTRPQRVAAFVEQCRAVGLPAAAAAPDAVRSADIVVCCTSSATPLFDGNDLAAHATVVAMGSHSPDARETDTTTATRATVVVEDFATALREAGDVIIPVADGDLDASALVPLAEIVRGERRPDGDRPRLFKSTGMAWQDLVVAARAYRGR